MERNIKLKSIFDEGRLFEENKTIVSRKEKGVFYTPQAIVEYMVNRCLESFNIVKNPYIKIIDPACGVGYFLLHAFKVLRDLFESNYENILFYNPELQGRLTRENVGKFILENNIWGADVDAQAIELAVKNLRELAGEKSKVNIMCCDSLTGYKETEISFFSDAQNDIWNNQYDLVIGNPPYIGHKNVSSQYKKLLQKFYGDIYKDKSDISYCFVKMGIDLLKHEGKLCFITSRYFMEGPSAVGLRKYIEKNCSVEEIVDFSGHKVFEDAGVSTCIITLRKSVLSDTRVMKFEPTQKIDHDTIMNKENYRIFHIKPEQLKSEGWIINPKESYDLYLKIENKGNYRLEELFFSYQGIITGCDKAFIMTPEEAEANGIEKDLLRPWIKNSHVQKDYIKPPSQVLIYSNSIERESDYPNAIKYIEKHRDKLEKRRECKNGVRKWYELQWGRKKDIFLEKKIVYPFKSTTGRFAVDTNKFFCSADVYILIPKAEILNSFSLEYITAVLNSRLFEFYFKCFGKRISENMYDYYPNTVLKMKLDLRVKNEELFRLSRQIACCSDEKERNIIRNLIDRELYKMYCLDEDEIVLVNALK